MDNGWTSNGDFTRAGIADRCQLPVQPLTIIILANFACPRKIFIFQPTVLFLPFPFLLHRPIRFDRTVFDRFFEFLSFGIVRSTFFDFVCISYSYVGYAWLEVLARFHLRRCFKTRQNPRVYRSINVFYLLSVY